MLLELVMIWEGLYRNGLDPSPESICAGHPELIGDFQRRMVKQKGVLDFLQVRSPVRNERDRGEQVLPAFPGYETLGLIDQRRDGRRLCKRGILTLPESLRSRPLPRAGMPRWRRSNGSDPRPRPLPGCNIQISWPSMPSSSAKTNRTWALEFAAGGSLARRLGEKPMAPREAGEMLETLARAVEAAHQAGVVHRDLKPSNILLTSDDVPKVADFGLAKLLDADSGRTVSGEPVGTPSYMAPEQAEGRSKNVGPVADVYALGAILYEMLTGRPPFLGESQIETLRLVCSTEPVPPKQSRPDIPRDLETICLKCLDKEPTKRYASAGLLAEDLRRFLDHRPITARPVGPAGRLRRWSRRNPWVAALSAAVLVSLLVGTGVSATLAFRAIRAEAATRQERDRAASEAANAKAVNEFLRTDLLAQASAHNQARPGNDPDPDLKVRTALDRAAAKIGERFADQPLIEASIRQTIGDTYFQLGLYPQALPHLQRALDLRRRALGDNDPDTLAVMGSLGAVYMSDGRLSEAEPLLLGALDGLRSARGREHPETLAAISPVAQLYCEQGKLADAQRLLIQLREAYLRSRGADDPETLDATNGLAMVYHSQKKPKLAEALLLELLREAPHKLGIDHPTTLIGKCNLGQVYESLGNYSEAERLYNEAIVAQKRVLGNKHPDTLASIVTLGIYYGQHDKLDEAEALLVDALEGCRTALDRNHEATDNALAGLAVMYSKKRDMRRLGAVLLESAEITRYRWGIDNFMTSHANQSVGMFFLVQREYDKAESCFRDCLTYWVKNSPDHWDRFFNELQYGVSLLAGRKYAEAKHHLLIGYNGISRDREHSPPEKEVGLGWLTEKVYTCRGANGHPFSETTLSVLHRDPALRAIVLDLQFPADPFAR